MARFVGLLTFIVVCVLALSNATAQTNLGFMGVGVRLGYVSPEDVDGTFGLGVFADLGTFAPRVMFEGYADYWSSSEDIPTGGEASARDIVLGARAKYAFPVNHPKIQPYIGGGLGIHFVSTEVSTPAIDMGGGVIIPAMTLDDSTAKLGLDFGGGMNFNVNETTAIQGELWYGIVSDVNQFSAKVGVLYRLSI